MPDELTKALLLEEVASPRAIASALFASVNGGTPLVTAFVETGATTSETLARYLARGEAPFLRQIVPLSELIGRLPPGLCQRLFAIPVRHDAITGTIDVVVADVTDLHPANEIGYHLGAPVRLVRATPGAIDEALRKMRNDDLRRERDTTAVALPEEDERMYDSRPRAPSVRPPAFPQNMPPLPAPAVSTAPRPRLSILPDSVPPPPPAPPVRIRTPPWGTPVHSDPPPGSGYGSEIPLPLTRKTYYPAKVRGGTQRPPGMVDPTASALGEGYAFDATGFRDVVERSSMSLQMPNVPVIPGVPAGMSAPPPLGSFIPGPPPVPQSTFGQPAAQFSAAEMSGVIQALKQAGSRDEVLELVLTGARLLALKVGLFVVKKGGYLGWMCSPELADRSQLQSVLVPLEEASVFDRAVREDIYLGPIRYDDVHAPLLRVLRNPTRDVAVLPIRVSGRTAVVIMADELFDTMIGTRRLEELARAAGEAFARIVRTKR